MSATLRRCGLPRLSVLAALALIAPGVFASTSVQAQKAAEAFTDLRDGTKLHTESGFACPAHIGRFERDAAGLADTQSGAVFCSYAALDGVYGTIRLVPLAGPYDAKSSLAPGFVEQEGTGGHQIAESVTPLTVKSGQPPVPLFMRVYETARLEELHYCVLFAGARFGNWAVETTLEYADPRDAPVRQQFLLAVYAAAESRIAPH